MQSRYLKFFVLIISSSLILNACSKSNEQATLIPKDASFVLHFDGKNIQSKLSWEEIKQNDWYIQMLKDSSASSFVKSMLNNPENSGIDVNGQLYSFMKHDSLGSFLAFTGHLKDVEKFKLFSQEITKTNAAATDDDGLFSMQNAKLISSWKKEQFLIIMDLPKASGLENMIDYSQPESATKPPVVVSSRNLKSQAKQLFNLKSSDNLSKDARFAEMVATSGDVHMWVNTEALYSVAMTMPMGPMSMLNLNKLYTGSIFTLSISFEAGKILAASKSYAGKELSEIWKKYSGNKIDGDMLKRLPSKDVAAVFAFNFKPQGIVELLKLGGLDGLVNMGLGTVGLSTEDIVKANKGDLFFAITDLKVDESDQLKPNVLFATAIGDKASFDKLLTLAKSDAGAKLDTDSSIAYNMGDKYFVIGNNKPFVEQYAAGTVKNDFDFYNKLSESALTGFINFQNILGKVKMLKKSQDTVAMAYLLSSEKRFENVIFSGGVFNDGGFIQNMEINLMDNNTNSLKQLNGYFSEIAAIKKLEGQTEKMDTVIADE